MGDAILSELSLATPTLNTFGTLPGAAFFFSNIFASSPNSYAQFTSGTELAGCLSAGFTDMVSSRELATNAGDEGLFGPGTFDGGTTTIRDDHVLGSQAGGGWNDNGVATYLANCFGTDADFTPTTVEAQSALGIILGNKIQAYAGDFFLNSTTGNQDVTAPGFSPDIVIFLGCTHSPMDNPTAVERENEGWMLGAMDKNGNQFVSHNASIELSGPGGTGGLNQAIRESLDSSADCIAHIGMIAFASPTTVDQRAQYVSMLSNGFRIHLSAAGLDSSGNQMRVMYIALKGVGGNGNFACGTIAQGASTISPGFAPDVMMFASSHQVSDYVISDQNWCCVGATDGTQQMNCWIGNKKAAVGANANTEPSFYYFSNVSCIRLSSNTPVLLAEATAAFSGSTVNLTWSMNDGTARQVHWIAFHTQNSTIYHSPVATTGAASPGGTHARLNGIVTPNSASPVSYFFEWGPSSSYGSVTPTVVDGTGPTPTPVSANITGLTPGFTYHYRLDVTLGGCQVDGVDRTFKAGSGLVFRNRFRAEAGGSGGGPSLASAYHFNGSSNYGSVAVNLSPVTSELFLRFWLYSDGWDDTINTIILEYTADSSANPGGVLVQGSGPGQPGLIVFGCHGSTFSDLWSITRPPAGAWHHYLLNVTPFGGQRAWINGVSAPVSPFGSSGSHVPFANSTLYVMARATSAFFLAGAMTGLAIFNGDTNRPLTNRTCGSPLTTFQNPGFPSPVLGWWPMPPTTESSGSGAPNITVVSDGTVDGPCTVTSDATLVFNNAMRAEQ